MRADQLAEQVPIVRRATTGAEAARIVAEFRLNALVVGDESGIPIAVVPGSQLLSVVLPQYVRDDPKLAMRMTRWAPTNCAPSCARSRSAS